jgi:hypothetical protein
MNMTKVIVGTGNVSMMAVFTEIVDSNNEKFLCFSDSDGFSMESKEWISENLSSALYSRESMFILGCLFNAGFKNVEITSFHGFMSQP